MKKNHTEVSEEYAVRCIEDGAQNPIDRRQPIDQSYAAALGIFQDLRLREGLEDAFEEIDLDTLESMVDTAATIIRIGMENGTDTLLPETFDVIAIIDSDE